MVVVEPISVVCVCVDPRGGRVEGMLVGLDTPDLAQDKALVPASLKVKFDSI